MYQFLSVYITSSVFFVCLFLNCRMKPLVQLVHSLKSRMESPDHEMVGHCIKEQKVGNFQNISSTGREKVMFNFRLDSLIQYFLGF